jgi:hypothetical protein
MRSRDASPRVPIVAALVVGLALAACKSAGETRASRVVPPAELPADLRATWEIYRAGGAAWEIERERVIADPARLRFVVDNLVIEMVRAYERSRLTTAGQIEGPFERAQRELTLMPAGSTPVLVELLGVKDGIVAFLAADVLERIGEPALAGVTAKLESETPEVRRRAAELLAELPHGGAEEAAIHEALGRRVRDDDQWIVRAQAAQTLGVRGARHDHKGYCLAVLSRALADPDPAVAASACSGLAALSEPRAIPALSGALERAAGSGDLKVVRAAQDALRALSGIDRDLGPAEWASWWRDQRRSAKPPGH